MNRFRAQDGSIPLSLLVVIVVGGLVASLFALVRGTQDTVGFDRQYAEAITVADAGLQQALTYLQVYGDTYPVSATPIRAADIVDGAGDPMFPEANRELGAGVADWEAVKLGFAEWEVRAAGQVGEVTRVLEGRLEAEPEFFLAAFGEFGITMNGFNLADSYGSIGELGAVGSNNEMTLRGNTEVDLIYQYGGTASCTGNGCGTGTVNGFDEAYDMDVVRTNVLSRHYECAGSFSAWRASTAGLPDSDGDGALELAPGTTICATDVVIDTDLEIPGASQDDPVQFMVTTGGEVTIDKMLTINCETCATDGDNRVITGAVSGALRFYSLGDTFAVGLQTMLGAGVLAPNATCRGNPSGAHADVFGSLICAQVGTEGGNQGGWSFHFDENLLRIGSGKLDIETYREEAGSREAGFDAFTP